MGEWRKAALTAFIGLSLTSLFADVAYEGARSVSGPFLGYLGAGAIVAGALGVGDLIAHAARVAGGVVAHRLREARVYWVLVFTGYTVNLVAVPLLALAGLWWEAFALYVIERVGKGLRAAPRDAILASVAHDLGPRRRGLIFSLHEVADQLGAFLGGVVVAAVIASGESYPAAFAALAIPAAASLASLAYAYKSYPNPRVAGEGPGGKARIPGWAAPLAVAAGLGTASFMHWGLASYTLFTAGTPAERVALMYSLAMASDALAAIPIGLLYDTRPWAALALAPLASAAATTFLVAGSSPLTAAVMWGVAMAFYETSYKAAAARAPPGARAAVYTLMYAAMGLGWTLGNLALASLLHNPTAAAGLAWSLGLLGALAALRVEGVRARGKASSPATPNTSP